MNDTDARLWHPWLRINRVLRAMLHERWSAEAWPQVKAEFKKALALRGQIVALLVGGLVLSTIGGWWILTHENGRTAPRLVLGVSLTVAWVAVWVFMGFAWLKLRSLRPTRRRWR